LELEAAGKDSEALDKWKHIFLRGLSDAASGIVVEEKNWFNDSTDAAALAEVVAHHIARSASGRSHLGAIISAWPWPTAARPETSKN
jgi:hypothetical protein